MNLPTSADTQLLLEETKRESLLSSINDNVMGEEWPCAACGCLLGVCHFSIGLSLLVFDIFTNNTSETAFAITAALTYVICALLCFIAARRIDKCAQLLLFLFSSISAIISLSIFLESAVVLNRLCSDHSCLEEKNIVHTVLICLSLFEFVVSIATVIVCFRSLRNAFGVSSANSPYSTLMIGDYRTLERQPRVLSQHRGYSVY